MTARTIRKVHLVPLSLLIWACGEQAPPCDFNGKCLPSYVCQAGECVRGEETTLATNCGPVGCDLEAAEQAILRIPPRALTESLQVTVSVASAGISTSGKLPLSPIYRIEPLGHLLQAPARFEFLVRAELGVEAKDLRVYWAETAQDTWKPLTGASETMLVVGELDRLGLVFVGRR